MLRPLRENEVRRIKQRLQGFYEKNPDSNPTALRDEMQKVIKGRNIEGFDIFRKDTERVISNNIQDAF